MSDTMQSLDQLSSLKSAESEAPKHTKKVDKYGRAYATGKRKDAVARVWIKPGAGKILVNAREVDIYFARPVLRMMIQQPLVAAARLTKVGDHVVEADRNVLDHAVVAIGRERVFESLDALECLSQRRAFLPVIRNSE